ncbi:MAG: hypothetical protein IAC58_07155 [Firmicutes bacterium]|uniref:Uncharacterized protein n=1 Tax=Candidatus Onthovivens merdipullorum TaxID=2840889 RepID=A0A9D9GXV5_9BACL|nr:hypothetical protein [Candidatus Onthovivens merdipullorum]
MKKNSIIAILSVCTFVEISCIQNGMFALCISVLIASMFAIIKLAIIEEKKEKDKEQTLTRKTLETLNKMK